VVQEGRASSCLDKCEQTNEWAAKVLLVVSYWFSAPLQTVGMGLFPLVLSELPPDLYQILAFKRGSLNLTPSRWRQ
jgi:hypothetical protein